MTDIGSIQLIILSVGNPGSRVRALKAPLKAIA